MLKNVNVMEMMKGDNLHQYHLPSNCSVGEVLDVLTEFRGYALNILIQEHKKSEEQVNEMKKQLESMKEKDAQGVQE